MQSERQPATRHGGPDLAAGSGTTDAASAGRAVEGRGLPAATSSGAYRPIAYEPSPLWRSLYDRFFSHIAVDEGWADAVRQASARGHVVYIGRAQSFLDFLGLDYLVKKHALPLIKLTNDLGMSVLEPFGRGSRRLRNAAPIPEESALADTIAAGASALLFLRRPPSVSGALTGAKEGRAGAALDVDLVRTLVELQRKTEKPIILLPQTLVWTKRTPNKQPTLVDVLFGPSDWPGRVRTSLQFLLNYKNAIHRGGEPFDLLAFLGENQDLTDAQAADAVRYALLRRMERERTIILGPARKTGGRLKDELLRSPRLRRHMQLAAKEGPRPLAAIEAETRRELDRLAASPDTNVVGLMDRVLRVVWDRIYDGLVVDEEGMARVREAARHGPLVLVPSHKSHVDYLVVSSVFYQRGLAPPLIAAGDNLSFFPLGTLFRNAGAFFIRRSFKGQKLYPHIVDAYIRKVLHEGHSIEVFVEGGRSRTGKLLPPKLGILSMIVDAGLGLSQPVQFVPISIGYERIIEEGSYVHELEGGEKQKEDLGGLLRAPRVLRSRYGRLYLQFGEIFDLASLHREAAGLDPEATGRIPDLSPAKRRALVSRIAHRITYEIDRVTMVTPASLLATVLLIHEKRGITRTDLRARAEELVQVFRRLDAPVARAITDRAGALRPDTLETAIALFLDAKLVTVTEGAGDASVLAVPEGKRLAVEYFKNNVLHFFVPSALVASSLAALGWEAPMTALRDRVRELSRLFKLEFHYRADAPFEEIFSDALGRMIEAGEVIWEGDVVRRGPGRDGARVEVYAEMIRTYLEAYVLALDSVKAEQSLPVARKDWSKQILARGQRAFAAGDITLRETVSKPKLESALSAFHELGLVRLDGNDIREGGPEASASLARWRTLLESHLAR
jgi:glycerol-3-phosphate O-acyltransferase